MPKFEIERGVPCPKPESYPFDKMEIGDSFFIEHTDSVVILRSAVLRYKIKDAKENPSSKKDFTVRIIKDSIIESHRCWRIE